MASLPPHSLLSGHPTPFVPIVDFWATKQPQFMGFGLFYKLDEWEAVHGGLEMNIHDSSAFDFDLCSCGPE